MPDNTESSNWVVYILRCADDSLYTGITNDIDRRLDEHNGISNNGARYTRGRRPVKLAWLENSHNRRSALRREYEIKQLSRGAKQQLIAEFSLHGSGLADASGPDAN